MRSKEEPAVRGGRRALGLHPSEVFTVAALLTFGTLFALMIPLGAGWDEETHQIRVWELAHLRFIPNEVSRNELPYPAIYWNLSYRRQLIIRPVGAGFWAHYGAEPIDGQGYLYAGAKTRSLYSPPTLLPYTLVMRYLGLKFDLSALTVFYASRLAGLAAYTLLAWLAVRLVPYGKWTVAVVALTPTAVFQAATIGADPVSNGVAIVFIAGCLAASARGSVGWKEWMGLVALSIALFWAKGNLALVAILPFLVLPPSSFRMRGGYLLLALTIGVVGIVEMGGWTALAYSGLLSPGGDGSASAQFANLVRNPVGSFGVVLHDLWVNGMKYIRQWIGDYGYSYGSVPIPTYVLFAAAAFASWWADSASGSLPTRRARRSLALVFLVCAIGTSFALYLAVTPVGAKVVEGIQGRYFAAIAPLLGLAAVGAIHLRAPSRASWWAMGFLVTSLAAFGAGILLSYHVICGTAYYQPGLCYLPSYKNWAPNERFSMPISRSESLLQEVVAECDGLSQVRVWVDSSGLPADGKTVFVFRDPTTDKDLEEVTVANADLPSGGWVSLGFGPEWRSRDRLYLLRISPGLDSEPVGTRIALTLRQEYPEVKLTENRVPVDADVVFQYGCAAGLGKYVPAFRSRAALEG
jgi:hypothetical protein